MSVPHQCPVCGGRGCVYAYGPLLTGTLPDIQCHACRGRGVVYSPVDPKPCEIVSYRDSFGDVYWTGDTTETPSGMTA